MIKCLPKEVQGRLRSGVALPSLQQCVEELIVNSIDSGATCVGVRMDMDAFKVQVIDNGKGMSAEDMACVGNRYYTSKCSSLEDLEDLRFYGFRGEALASVVSLASLVEISSRTKTSVKTHVKIYREGEGLDVFEAEITRPSAGTTVTVCNFFHNMPVRRKRLDAVLENERIRQRVEAISLMHPSVSFTLKNDCTGVMVVQLPKARDTYYRFVQIHGLSRAQKLGEINFSCGGFAVKGYIGKEGHYNNSLQFLYVNERLLLKTQIHKLLSGLLRRLSSSSQKNKSPEVQPTTRSPKQKRCQDLYCVYVINIKCPYSEYDVCLEPAKTLIEFKDWNGILGCIEDGVKDFLRREDLVAELSQDDMESESPQRGVNYSSSTYTEAGQSVSGQFPKADSSIEKALSSELVYRSHANQSEDGLHCKSKVDKEAKDEEEINMFKCLSKSMDDSKSKKVEGEHLNIQLEYKKVEEEPKSNILVKQLDIKPPEAPKERTHSQSENCAMTHICPTSSQVAPNNIVPPTSNKQTSKKVILSDPYMHKSVEIKHSKNSGFQSEETLSAPKRRISLGTVQKTPCKEVSQEPVPVKIRKIVSLSNVSQSLDHFRRTYSKPIAIHPVNPVLRHINSEHEKSQQAFIDTNTEEEDRRRLLSPPTLTAFTKIKPIKLHQEKKSLATKLCHLRQQNKKEPCITFLPATELSPQGVNGITSDCSQENEDTCNTVHNLEPQSTHRSDQTEEQKTTSEEWLPQYDSSMEPKSSHSSDQTEEEQKTTSDEWLPHYDSSMGKTVYVNKITGLSSYEEPSAEQAGIHCSSDITNMAVSVISEAGEGDEKSNSLYSMYSKWSNPVYVRPPKVGVDIACGQSDGLSVKVHNILFPYRFTKAMIPTMKVINQVDKKFLACLIDTRENKADDDGESEGNLLVLVDQHAAHERVRLENLIADAYEDDSDLPGEKRLSSSIISPPLEISVPQEEQRLLRSCEVHLRSLGLEVTFSQEEDSRVFIGKVPMCFTEKDINERKRGRPSVIKPLVEEYLQEQIELLQSAIRLRATLPLTVQKVLASFACHGAIKFNDILNKNECISLVASLSVCQLPFQCAHGRPSIVPLVDLHHIEKEEKVISRPNLSKLRRMYKAWQLFGNR